MFTDHQIMAEKFCLKWNDFQTNVTSSFRKLRNSEDFYDVTLVSDDQKQISAHKIVLSASSEYFKNVLKSNKHTHPLLCLNGVNSNELNNILDYIYNGELQIYQDNLDDFLHIAQRFKLEGLMQNEEVQDPKQFHKIEITDNDLEIENTENYPGTYSQDIKVMVPKTNSYEKRERKMSMVSSTVENIEELDQKIDEMLEKHGTSWYCTVCSKTMENSSKRSAREHAETHFDGLGFSCDFCEKSLRSRSAYRFHKMRLHNK